VLVEEMILQPDKQSNKKDNLERPDDDEKSVCHSMDLLFLENNREIYTDYYK